MTKHIPDREKKAQDGLLERMTKVSWPHQEVDASKGFRGAMWNEGMADRRNTVDAESRQLFQHLVNYLKCSAWLSKMRTDRIWQLGGYSNLSGAQRGCRGLAMSMQRSLAKQRQAGLMQATVKDQGKVQQRL